MVTRIQRSDLTVTARTNLAVTLFGLLRAKYGSEASVRDDIKALNDDLIKLRKDYEPVIDLEQWAADARNEFDLYLDGIEYRLSEIVVKTKIIDTAGLREMAVPE
jgi:hypothetical protein